MSINTNTTINSNRIQSPSGYVDAILGARNMHKNINKASQTSVTCFAPTNIALCKYWGKRDNLLNLPVTDSLSLSLGNLGATTTLALSESQDRFVLNGQPMQADSEFAQRLKHFLDLFRPKGFFFDLTTTMTIPVAAGVASSACGYAALTEALNALFAWQLDKQRLSQLSRLGSGSAARSHWHGFVQWHAGHQAHGLDCYAEPINVTWPELSMAIVWCGSGPKKVSSRTAMQASQALCNYQYWSDLTSDCFQQITTAIDEQDLTMLGSHAQQHAVAMHDLIHQAGINYDTPLTQTLKQQIINYQKQGYRIYFTQDAGPHLKLLFHEQDAPLVQSLFPKSQRCHPWVSAGQEDKHEHR